VGGWTAHGQSRPSEGVVVGWEERIEEGERSRGTARVFIELEKRRLVRARALPNSGDRTGDQSRG
jgi:hypothetical protein